jgi:hypothetical protein
MFLPSPLRPHSFLCLYQPFSATAVILSFLPPHSYSCANGGKELGPPRRGVDLFLGDGKEPVRGCGRRSPMAEDEPGPTGVEAAADQSPGAITTRGLRGELHRLPREGARGRHQADSCGPSRITTGCSSITSPLTCNTLGVIVLINLPCHHNALLIMPIRLTLLCIN